MPSVTLRVLKDRLSEWIGRAHDLHEDVEVEIDGEIVAVIVDKRKYESLAESIAILSDADLLMQIDNGIGDRRTYTLDEIERTVRSRTPQQNNLILPISYRQHELQPGGRPRSAAGEIPAFPYAGGAGA